MHSPSPMQNGGTYGMPMNNPYMGGPPQQMRHPSMMQQPDDMAYMSGNPNFNNGMISQNNYNMMPNGGGNIMSPHQPSGQGPGQNSQMMMPPQQQMQPPPPPQMNLYNNQPQMMQSQTQQIMSPHNVQPSPIMNQYPQPGISPMPPVQQPNQMIQQQPPPQHNMIQQVHNSIMPNNSHNRVMSPGMMSPHHPAPPQMMNQGPPQSQQQQLIRGPPQQQQQQQPQNMLPPPQQMNRMNNMMQANPPQQQMMPPQMMTHNIQQLQQPQNMIMNHQSQGIMGPPNMMPQQQPQSQPNQQQSKLYPPNAPMIFNSQNPYAPPIYPCGACHREIQGDPDEGIMCESGCNFWFHRACIGMSPQAYAFLKKEIYAEWVCDNCIQSRPALVKFKS